MSMKSPLTLAGIEPATFRFVAQYRNHCATAVRESFKGELNYSFVITDVTLYICARLLASS